VEILLTTVVPVAKVFMDPSSPMRTSFTNTQVVVLCLWLIQALEVTGLSSSCALDRLPISMVST
jgi:hypothetical protein